MYDRAKPEPELGHSKAKYGKEDSIWQLQTRSPQEEKKKRVPRCF